MRTDICYFCKRPLGVLSEHGDCLGRLYDQTYGAPSNGGSPKTLNSAIWDGMVSVASVFPQGGAQLAKAIEEHVLMYLRQKFGATYLMLDELSGDTISKLLVKELAQQIGVEKRISDSKETK